MPPPLPLLPAACPAYLVAYAYTDVLEYAGVVQKAIRHFFDFNSPGEYYFPEIRSIWGAIFVMSLVLYPYIYVLARTAFRTAPASLYETAVVSIWCQNGVLENTPNRHVFETLPILLKCNI